MRYLITGATGFIGNTLTRRLAALPDANVHGVDIATAVTNQRTIAELEALPNFTLHRLNLLERAPVQDLILTLQPDAVLHLAAMPMPDRGSHDTAPVIQTNILGTYNILEATLHYWRQLPDFAQEDFRLLHVSADEIYGNQPGNQLATPNTAHAPSSPFAASKSAAAGLVQAWHQSYDLPAVIATLCHVYGSYQSPQKFIPAIILKAMHGEIIPIYGTGDNRREWLHVQDAVIGLTTVLQRGSTGQNYLLSGNEISNLMLAQKICDILDRLEPDSAHCPHRNFIQFAADRPGHDYRCALDDSKTRALHWHPQIALDEGLDMTVRWYLERQDWWQDVQLEYSGPRLGIGNTTRKQSC